MAPFIGMDYIHGDFFLGRDLYRYWASQGISMDESVRVYREEIFGYLMDMMLLWIKSTSTPRCVVSTEYVVRVMVYKDYGIQVYGFLDSFLGIWIHP